MYSNPNEWHPRYDLVVPPPRQLCAISCSGSVVVLPKTRRYSLLVVIDIHLYLLRMTLTVTDGTHQPIISLSFRLSFAHHNYYSSL